MQRIVNCILSEEDKVLVLQKPSHGWFVAPGGKMESGESIKETVVREFYEETGLKVNEPQLRGVFTIVIEEEGKVVDEWMMFTFAAADYEGELLKESPEGILSWQEREKVLELPMAAGDYYIFQKILGTDEVVVATFTYSQDNQLLAYKLDVAGQLGQKM